MAWNISGELIETCSCNMLCPCWFGQADLMLMDQGYCGTSLLLRVREGAHEGVMLYEGPLSGLSTIPLAVDPGSSVRLDFEVSLPADADNGLAGDYVKMTLYVDAEQAH